MKASINYTCGILIIIVHILVSVTLLLIVISSWEFHISDLQWWLIMTAWGCCCGVAHYWVSPMYILRSNTRKPTKAEAVPLQEMLDEIQTKYSKQTGRLKKKINIFIDETNQHNAFALGCNTIVLSKGMLSDFPREELLGVTAHEFGHITAGDSINGAAFYSAGSLHWLLMRQMKRFRKKFKKKQRIQIICVLFILTSIFAKKCIVAFILTVAYLLIIKYIERFFGWCWLLNARYTEYARDMFACELGYGAGLCAALERLSKDAPQPVNWFFIVMSSTHPVVFNRIRRLEVLICSGFMG